ncbi:MULTISPECIES: hypothetical protein [Staphylococcus]|uniref:hypothetical protein n=1 Tax=unclassified Staphylococcus TaxID=91994 RepID=UPI0008FB9C96|nr:MULTISPECIES: hypothetical protein [Staphylococcus]MDK7752930.1 hypothetical protein [Staphylococcus sp. UMB10092B]MDU9348487.1 hypothetical protein [Staphylococcus ureilyticus]OLF31874.1 hypothetical protein BSZ11_08335 [Staphylococcus sp. 47.1]PTG36647.1 hypothetical protein BUY24_12430 [Staphylococcus cohnii]PTG49806.1 hypothetical protein BUY26_00305 [Staphylococcus cohnii]
MKIFLSFIYFLVSFFVLKSLLDLVLPIEFDMYANLISSSFFAFVMTPFSFVLKKFKDKK